MKAIEVRNIIKKYDDVEAVNNVSFFLEEGTLFGLLGVNGAGKTTVIKMLASLIKPTSGEILIFEKNITHNASFAKQILNISPQETAVAQNLTVYENLEFIAGIYGLKKSEIKEKVNKIIDEFSLNEVKNKRAGKLSGGWMRRLSIAMGLISDPKILLLDEPTLGLDVLARRELWNIIKSLKGKITIILTTHYLEETDPLCDKIAIMNKGKIRAIGSPDELKKIGNSENFEDAFVNISTFGD